MRLEDYQGPQDLLKLSTQELYELCNEVRQKIIQVVEQNNGHLGSNLGVVELTMSLLVNFQLDEQDLILFDTGHETYPYKILTDRLAKFPTIRTFNGLSGFQDINESPYDALSSGHAGTALSTAIGYALTNRYRHIVVVIGDAAFLNGMNLEALNHLGTLSQKIIIVLNDNGMSISKNISILQKISSRVRANNTFMNINRFIERTKYVPVLQGAYWVKKLWKTIFKNLDIPGLFTGFNLDYIGPLHGHKLEQLNWAFRQSKRKNRSTVVHVKTIKGYGYQPAMNDACKLHSFSKTKTKLPATLNWSNFVAASLEESYQQEPFYLISAAMQSATGFNRFFEVHSTHAVDVGISEEHAITVGVGLKLSGAQVMINMYSTFLQRAYDQILHDVVRNQLAITFLIDRAGLNGADGISHHGLYDVQFLASMGSNLIISQPASQDEFQKLLSLARANPIVPFFIRYPKAEAPVLPPVSEFQIGEWAMVHQQPANRICLITFGNDITNALAIIQQYDLPIDLVNARFFQPISREWVHDNLFSNNKYDDCILYEPLVGPTVLDQYLTNHLLTHQLTVRLHSYHFTNGQIHHGTNEQLLNQTKMDLKTILLSITAQHAK